MREKIPKGWLASFLCLALVSLSAYAGATTIRDIRPNEDVFAYIQRVKGAFDQTLYQQVIGAANAFKEGDEAIGVAATDDMTRLNARKLLVSTKIKDLTAHPLSVDEQQKLIAATMNKAQYEKVRDWTVGQLKEYILTKSEAEVKGIMDGLDSDNIANVVRLMSNEELTAVGQKIFNPLPGSKLGAKGYMGARIQPNSPTDNVDDIVWQTFNGFCFATGDIVIGTNPVDSQVENIANIQRGLKDVVDTFKLNDVIPWCVLAHIDVQAQVREKYPGLVTFYFQSLAGNDCANKVFDVSIDGMMKHAKARKGEKYGLYYETGQGADFTNGCAEGVDMVTLESRKYGYARALKQELAKVQPKGAWTHFNDVAGFIGPEVFKNREQLVRCCLEDIAMGKLHGLVAGLDICSTLHMPVSLEDLDWCMDRIMPANPAYLMALPTKNDPMLSYLTTAFQDHVRVREKFGYKVNDAMWDFYKRIGIVDKDGKYTEHYGDPVWVYYQYRLAKGDKRTKEAIYAEGEGKLKEIEARGVPIARGHGKEIYDLNPELAAQIQKLYEDAKVGIWAEWNPDYMKAKSPNALQIATNSKDREDYIAHPSAGEELSPAAVATLEKLRDGWAGKTPDVQIVISDGLDARALMDDGHLEPFLVTLRKELNAAGFSVGEKNIVVSNGRVRAGYMVGSLLFAKADAAKPKAILHVIGERPGSGHHQFSVYISTPKAQVWAEKKCDHDITKVVSGLANTAADPADGAKTTVKLLKEMVGT